MATKTTTDRLLDAYPLSDTFLDEVYNFQGKIRKHYQKVKNHLAKTPLDDFKELNDYARTSSFDQGITFNVYSEKAKGTERIFPFDLFPRIIPKKEWEYLEKGLNQRNQAINLFLKDIYGKKHILKDNILPKELILSSKQYCKHMQGFTPKADLYVHISGTDIIKHSDGNYYVLEDNLRCPSGVSYVLANRQATKRTLSDLFFRSSIDPVVDYPEKLAEVLKSVAPQQAEEPTCVLLTPGMYNSAYFEHSFLALLMGIQLVEGRDLIVENNFVYMKTIHGPKRVDVIYRRIDDDFLDPSVFRKDSMLGVSGLMKAYRAGNVTLVNAPGTGVADDKAVYTYIPDVIRYYLNEEPILNNVHTYHCYEPDDLKYVLENMHDLVVKPVDESGGYGIFIGPATTKAETAKFKKTVLAQPRKYIAQPVMKLSVHATFIEENECFEPRHIDLRTFSLMGKGIKHVCKGGLTRVALKKGQLIVNSSQGGGSKDTWVLQK